MTQLTEAEMEARYDAERAGTLYTTPDPSNPYPELRAQIDQETDPDMRKRLIFRLFDQILADGARVGLSEAQVMDDLERLSTADGDGDWVKMNQITPLGSLSNGVQVQGLHDRDGSPHCARIETDDGCLYAGDDSVLSGLWAGRDFEMTIDQVHAFRRLFAGDTIEQFMVIAAAWDSGQPLPQPAAAPAIQIERLHNDPNEDDDNENPITPEEEAAYDTANRQKVYDEIKAAFDAKNGTSLFVDTLPGRVHGDVPIDIAVAIGIGAAMERNLCKIGITRDQMFRILEVAVNPVVNEYLITPNRRMRLIWDGM